MNTIISNRKYTEEEYLALEEKANVRHEFINGNLFEMPGGTKYHERTIRNLFTFLNRQSINRPLELFFAGMRVNIKESDIFFYPDIVISVETGTDLRFYEDAVFIAAVLSPSTRTFDSVDKFIEYRKLPSLRYYMLVEPDYYHVTLHQKTADGTWESETYKKMAEEVPLPLLGISIPMQEIYGGIEWE